MKYSVSRRSFIKNTAGAVITLPLGLMGYENSGKGVEALDGEVKLPAGNKAVPFDKGISISVFSKHLQWLNYKDLAEVAASIGFDGIDLTVRHGGHVVPERVKTDLPVALHAIKQKGLKVDTITTDIVSATGKYADGVLHTIAQCGIRNYRMGWYSYNELSGVTDNIRLFKKSFKKLADKNRELNIRGQYENHTGFFGASVWDLWSVLDQLPPEYIGCQFDIQHAIVDGAKAWPVNLALIKDYIGSVTIKDFIWEKTNGAWGGKNVPLGQGMVDFDSYFTLLKKYGINVPFSMHFEYPLGGAENGANILTIDAQEVIRNMKADLSTLKTLLKQHQLI